MKLKLKKAKKNEINYRMELNISKHGEYKIMHAVDVTKTTLKQAGRLRKCGVKKCTENRTGTEEKGNTKPKIYM